MALIACSECRHMVSDKAASCPNCGHPVSTVATAPILPPQAVHVTYAPPQKRSSGCAIVVVGLLTLCAIAFCSTAIKRGNKTPTSSASAQPKAAVRTPAELLRDSTDPSRGVAARLFSAEELASRYPESAEAKQSAAALPELREEVRLESLGKQWRYSASDDEMSGKKMAIATVTSTNTHTFDFPYAGEQHGSLRLRKHPRYGNDVILAIEKGQLQCRSYSGCSVLVRFGDSEPKTYRATGPEDNSSETLFIEGYADFQRRMQAVSVVRIQASVFQEGAPSWEFDVSGFNPDKMK